MDIQIYDTTLRDGTQREGISLSCDDKLRIAARLDDLGVAFIEGGWPGSNPKDAEFFSRASGLRLRHATITSFGSTCRVGGKPEEDVNIAALLASGTSACALVGKSSLFHVREVLRTTPEENLRIIRESTAYLVGKGRRVMYDAEHFFDGFVLDREYALATLRAAAEGGAEILVLCDTNGGTMPWDIGAVVADVRRSVGAPLGIHTHNDGECAVANALAAVREGAVQVQGTINGYGERCGNANLVSLIADMTLKMGCSCIPEGNLARLTDTAHYVAEIANLSPDNHLPYVGKSAFAHKGGIHVAAIRRTPASYQHCDPALVGNAMRVVVSELSGRANLASKSEEFGLGEADPDTVTNVLGQIKALEAKGFSFEAAEASVALMMRRERGNYAPPFRLIDLTVNVEHRDGRGIFAEATVKLDVGGEVIHTVAEGNGPVNALDTAVRKALTPVYPKLATFRLADYKVRILDGTNGTGATTRVLIETRNGTRRWSTVGASANIIEASWRALADSIEFGLNGGGEETAA
ncbi:MAG TPA: citramalate synthase [Bacteroidota bacterium]|nr:citramalate synthase [Bacteroidota bacterium]